MRITFVMPGYPWAPMGGFKVVYEYANQLVAHGHQVAVVHAREVKIGVRARVSTYQRLKRFGMTLVVGNRTPNINWQTINSRVKLLFVPNTEAQHIPEGDAVFATAWNTVASVLGYDSSKGAKFYLIQGYEACMAPKELVDETWRAPLNKVVVSKWLLSLGHELGAENLHYIPNAVDHDQYRIIDPPHSRRKRVAMMFSHMEFKGSKQGVEALRIAKKEHSDLEAVFFGTGRSANWIPRWIPYHRNPPQDFIVREIYNKSSIFLSPSWAEGFALPPAEAACCGCAIVATDSGGIRDFIEHGETGLLSAPKDARALANNLCRLLEDQASLCKLAEAARQRLEVFRWDNSARMLETFLELVQFTKKVSSNVQRGSEVLTNH